MPPRLKGGNPGHFLANYGRFGTGELRRDLVPGQQKVSGPWVPHGSFPKMGGIPIYTLKFEIL